ncbi:hypothetical protein B0H63DRAFT_170287 [Podospora didyma]|uniref:Uncharacterized protein n=1 Tax=Podospora didyma TaxID=330526 RepID=A0AAE0TZ72_9PEZI|nr:hypothetical protein B0H63DRAFT_170287 [Podospora didyma]
MAWFVAWSGYFLPLHSFILEFHPLLNDLLFFPLSVCFPSPSLPCPTRLYCRSSATRLPRPRLAHSSRETQPHSHSIGDVLDIFALLRQSSRCCWNCMSWDCSLIIQNTAQKHDAEALDNPLRCHPRTQQFSCPPN